MQELKISYTVWKQVVQSNSFTPYFFEHHTNRGEVLAGTDQYLFTSIITADEWSDFSTTFSGTYQEVDCRDDALALIIGTTQIPSNKLTGQNVPKVAIEKPDDTFVTLYTHNWCDPTTWYQESEHVVSGVATDSGDHTVYELEHENIIDTYHGKVSGEDFLLDDSSNSFRVSVFVNGEQATEVDPHTEVGDFTVNYASGLIEFTEVLDEEDEVTATYHYATSGTFTLRPDAGKALGIEVVEVQVSDDVEITDTLTFTMYGYVDVFAPQLVNNPYPSGTKIPLANALTFKTMYDYWNDTIKAYPSYPALGGSGWRGMRRPIYIMDWDYVRSRVLYASYGMEIRIELQHDTSFGGDWATAAFYCVSKDE